MKVDHSGIPPANISDRLSYSETRQSGYTIVEVMVAIVILFIVLGGVYATITREKVDTVREQIILDLQANTRATMDFVVMEIRKAGFLGCGGDLAKNTLSNAGVTADWIDKYTFADQDVTINLTTGEDWNGTDPIFEIVKTKAGVDYLAVPMAFYNDAIVDHYRYKPGSDALSLVYLSGGIALGTAMGTGTDNPLKLSTTDPVGLNGSFFKQDDLMMLTDCRKFSVFQKTNGEDNIDVEHNNSGLNISVDLNEPYGTTAKAFKLNVSTLFIDKDNLSLCLNTKDNPVASNIEDLQFEFKVDTNKNGVLDEAWSDTFTWDSEEPKVAVRVWILAKSDLVPTYTDTNTYDYPNSPYTGGVPPGDAHYYRYLTSAIVYLRNSGT